MSGLDILKLLATKDFVLGGGDTFAAMMGRIEKARPGSVTPETIDAAIKRIKAGENPYYAAGELTGLDVSTAARGERSADWQSGLHATRKGEHGSPNELFAFDPWKSTDQTKAVHFGEEGPAHRRLGYRPSEYADDGEVLAWAPPANPALSEEAAVFPVKGNLGSTHEVEDLDTWGRFETAQNMGLPPGEYHAFRDGTPQQQMNKIKELGDSVSYFNRVERDPRLDLDYSDYSPGADSWGVFDPRRLRSRHAVFDPAHKDTPYILAAGAPLGLAPNRLMGAAAPGSPAPTMAEGGVLRDFNRQAAASSAAYYGAPGAQDAGGPPAPVEVWRDQLSVPEGSAASITDYLTTGNPFGVLFKDQTGKQLDFTTPLQRAAEVAKGAGGAIVDWAKENPGEAAFMLATGLIPGVAPNAALMTATPASEAEAAGGGGVGKLVDGMVAALRGLPEKIKYKDVETQLRHIGIPERMRDKLDIGSGWSDKPHVTRQQILDRISGGAGGGEKALIQGLRAGLSEHDDYLAHWAGGRGALYKMYVQREALAQTKPAAHEALQSIHESVPPAGSRVLSQDVLRGQNKGTAGNTAEISTLDDVFSSGEYSLPKATTLYRGTTHEIPNLKVGDVIGSKGFPEFSLYKDTAEGFTLESKPLHLQKHEHDNVVGVTATLFKLKNVPAGHPAAMIARAGHSNWDEHGVVLSRHDKFLVKSVKTDRDGVKQVELELAPSGAKAKKWLASAAPIAGGLGAALYPEDAEAAGVALGEQEEPKAPRSPLEVATNGRIHMAVTDKGLRVEKFGKGVTLPEEEGRAFLDVITGGSVGPEAVKVLRRLEVIPKDAWADLKGLHRNHDFDTDEAAVAHYYANNPKDPAFKKLSAVLQEMRGIMAGQDPTKLYDELKDYGK